MQQKLADQRDGFMQQAQQIEQQLMLHYSKKEKLKTDKETLLDYAKDSIEKQQ